MLLHAVGCWQNVSVICSNLIVCALSSEASFEINLCFALELTEIETFWIRKTRESPALEIMQQAYQCKIVC